MKVFLMIVLSMCGLAPVANAQNTDWAWRLDAPPPKAARDLVERGLDLAGRDRIDKAVAILKKAVAAAPYFLEAHIEYIRLKSDFQGKVDEVKAEYEALMAKEPENPVYPMALAEAIFGNRMARYKKVVELAPEWSWGHYARSYLILGRSFRTLNEQYEGKGEQILAEVLKAIEKNGSAPAFHNWAISIQEDLGKIDDAILTAEKMAAQPELRAEGLGQLWRLRIAKAKGSDEAMAGLKAELVKLSRGSRDIKLLAAVRKAYVTLLKDPAGADGVERQIRRLDPAWYPERGKASFLVEANNSGVPYALLIANRQFMIHEKAKQITLQREPDWRKVTRRLESLFALGPNPALKKFIYSLLFVSARNGGSLEAMIKYGEQMYALDETDVAPLARIALAMADKKADPPRALDYARRAEAALTEFRPMTRPPDIPVDEFASRFSPKNQQENHRRQQALALDAVGRVLFQMGQAKEAEPKLRQSLELNRTETALAHLAQTLKQLGHNEEAEKLTAENDAKLLESVKSRFVNRSAKDFQLEAIDGRKHRLSDLKGKVVLVNFWATWCGPCVGEMPLFASVYEKYKEQGFELIAVSDDDPADHDLVREFVQKHQLKFPVLYDDGIARLYDVGGYPVSVFIDRQGSVRYLQDGPFEVDGRRLEIILQELLK